MTMPINYFQPVKDINGHTLHVGDMVKVKIDWIYNTNKVVQTIRQQYPAWYKNDMQDKIDYIVCGLVFLHNAPDLAVGPGLVELITES